MRVKIKNLCLKNFKGLSGSFDFGGASAKIWGRNASGKTTLFDGFCWLLFDKNSQGQTIFEVKTLTASGEPEHGLEHEVQAVLSVDGKSLTLRKMLTEKWTKKRGSLQKQFTGHEVQHWVDGVPVKQRDYQDRVATEAPEEMFRLLTSPTYFPQQLHWEKRRQILLEICGDVDSVDVFQANAELTDLPAILQGRKLDDHKKIIEARRREINDVVKKIPTRIDEAQRSRPALGGNDVVSLQKKLASIEDMLSVSRQKLTMILAGGDTGDLHREISAVEFDMQEFERRYRQEWFDLECQKSVELQEKTAQLRDMLRQKMSLEEGLAALRTRAKTLEESLAQKRLDFSSVNAKTTTIKNNCPTCGQKLPAESVAAAHQQFESDRRQKLNNINTEGRSLAAELTGLREKMRADNEHLTAVESQLSDVQAVAEKLSAEVERIKTSASLFARDPEYISLKEKLVGLREQMQAKNNDVEIAQLKKEIQATETNRNVIVEQIMAHEQIVKINERVETLKTEERSLAGEFERLERELYLCEQFTRRKTELLENKINSKFRMAKFKLFSEQINSGIAECCDAMFDGVPYSSNLNGGHRILVGLDILATLSTHYDISMPVFIDNAETITESLPKMPGQVIELRASADDQILRLEVEG